jgi:hypothetical protein
MTVSSTTSKQAFACDGTTDTFTCPFRVLAAADLRGFLITVATQASTELTNGVDFVVSRVGDANAVATTTATYSSAYQVKFERSTARLQLTDYRDNDPFPAEAHEEALDRLTHIAQEQDNSLSRAITLPAPETGAELPSAASRAGKLFGFNVSTGAPEASVFTQSQVAAAISALAPNGTSGTIILRELHTATAGQTVFNLANSYTPGVNSLAHIVDGVFAPVGVDGVETDSNTYTFNAGLLEGQQVEFIVGRLVTSGVEAWQVSYTAAGAGTVSRSQQSYNSAVTHSKDYYGNGEADPTVGVQAFWDRVTTVGGIAFIYPGDATLTAMVTITLATKGFHVIGGGVEDTRFIAGASFGGATPVMKIVGSGGQPGFSISGFSIRGSSTAGVCSATSGLQVGSTSILDPVIAGFNTSMLKGIFVADFPVGIDVVHARLIRFEDCSVWNNNYTAANVCLRIRQEGLFTTDLLFDRCQFVTSTASGRHCLRITSSGTAYNNSNGNGSVAGLKFRSCDFYAGDKSIFMYASGSSWIMDVWLLDGCQVDQETNHALYAESADSGANIADIHVDGVYVSKTNTGGIVFTSTGTGGAIQDIFVRDPWIDRATGPAVQFFGTNVRGVHVTDASIVDCDYAGGAVVFNGTQSFTLNGLTLRTGLSVQAPNYAVQVLVGCADFQISGVRDGGVATVAPILDQSGDVAKVIQGVPSAEATITVGASPFSHKNTSGAPQAIYITGGTVSGVTVNSRAVPTTSGLYHLLPHGKTITVTHSSAPTMYSLGAA